MNVDKLIRTIRDSEFCNTIIEEPGYMRFRNFNNEYREYGFCKLYSMNVLFVIHVLQNVAHVLMNAEKWLICKGI